MQSTTQSTTLRKSATIGATVLIASALGNPASSQTPTETVAAVTAAPVPFRVGEELGDRATFGTLRAGTAPMRVEGIEVIRGRPAYHVVFTIEGRIPFFRVRDRYESWIDIETLSSLRHRQQI